MPWWQLVDGNSSATLGRSPSLFYFCKKYPPKIRAARTRRSIAREAALRNAIITASSSGEVTQLYIVNSCRLAFAAHVKILSSRKRTQARSLAHSRLLANKVRPKTGLFDAIALRPWHDRNFIYPFIKKVASLLTRITYLDHDQLYCDLSRWDREQSLRLPRIDYTRSTCEAK